ncbi:MAG: aldose 1-epimerase family protein [Spirochaetales bacterium]|nr:aldose 1-epimerase family protein [Spirochaetales bacterium]
MRIGDREFSRREIERRIGNITQLGGTRHVELADGRSRGVRAIEFDTGGGGLRFTVLPERGMDIADFSWRGLSLVYHTPGSIAHPAFYDPAGMEWLRTFSGGLLTTCGLTYFGNPGQDGEVSLGLHGRYSALPASRVCDLSRWEGDEYLLEVTACVEEASLFGEKLRLSRSISTRLGSKRVRIRDTVENYGGSPAPFTILYHVNTGFPLLDAQSGLLVGSSAVEPYDEVSGSRLDVVDRFQDPEVGFPNLDYLHTMAADPDGYAWAAMVNHALAGGLGLSLRFDTSTLPFLNEWKMLSEVDYVVGIEPVNTIILNRAELRRQNRLPQLEPGERRSMEVEFGVLEGASEIDAFAARIAGLTGGR